MVRCLAFGLLLARSGLPSHFCEEGSYGSGLFNPTIVPVRRTYFRRNALDLRTIIVIADIYRGLYSPAQHINTLDHPYLTFRHRSGVTPYTSTFVLAGSCVFVKQSPGNLSLRPRPPKRLGQALSRSYGRFFAEFLEDLSLVRLSLLDSTTCVGLRYGTTTLNPNEVFLGSVLPSFL